VRGVPAWSHDQKAQPARVTEIISQRVHGMTEIRDPEGRQSLSVGSRSSLHEMKADRRWSCSGPIWAARGQDPSMSDWKRRCLVHPPGDIRVLQD